MSLPVKMFEPKSTLQRIVDAVSYAPHFITKACDIEDPLERFKHVIATPIAAMHLCTGQLKPFNPILGETLEAELADGSKLYCEHISHHPPITCMSMEDVNGRYSYNGSVECTASLGANHLKAG